MIKSISIALGRFDFDALSNQAAARGVTLETHCAEILAVEAAILHDGPRDPAAVPRHCDLARLPLTPLKPAPPARALTLIAVALGFYLLIGVGAAVTLDRIADGAHGAGTLAASGALWPVMLGAAAVQAGVAP